MKTRSPIGYSIALCALFACMTAPAIAQDAATKNADIAQPDGTAAPKTAPSNPVQRRIVEYQGKTRGIEAGETVRSAESTKRLTAREAEIDDLKGQLTAALSLPPASPERPDRIDQTYYALRRLVDRLRDDRNQAIMMHRNAVNERDDALEALIDVPDASDELRESIDQYRSALASPVQAVQNEIDTASAHLTLARKLRRRAEHHASIDALKTAHSGRLHEAASEIRSIPIDVQSSIRRMLDEWWQQPKKLNQLQALGSLFFGLMELAFLLVMGIWVHRKIPIWTQKWLRHLATRGEPESWSTARKLPAWLVDGDLKALSGVAGPTIQDLLVLLLSTVVMIWLHDSLPLVSWLALIFAAGACIRLAQGAIELALITPSENRPALRVTEEAVRSSLLWIAQTFGLLFAVEIIMNRLLLDILAADRVAELLGEAIDIIAVGLLAWGLARWGQTIRGRVKAGGTESTIAQWISATHSSRVVAIFASATAVILLIFRLGLALIQSVIENRAGLSWLSAALARRQLREESATDRKALPLPTRNAIGQGSLRTLHVDEYVHTIQQRYQSWKTDPRRGLVAVTGDRGCGKSALMETLAHTLDGTVVACKAPIGATTQTRALEWLIASTGIQAEPNAESVIEALNAAPSSIFLLSNLHRLYIRAVGGYEGLDSVLTVMQATGRTHFWVVSFHGPAWSFFAGMSHIGNVGVFPTRVQIQPLGPADLSAWLLSQTRTAGFQPRFDGMLQRPVRGPDRSRTLERTERAYWRLLADASMGNPTVAVRLWVDGLRETPTDSILDVTVPRAHDVHELENLEDNELFTLTAIILHDDISVEELHRVLNMDEAHVRATCRGLEQLTLITETDHSRYKVRLNWLPAVERHLRRRSFIHKS